MSEGLESWKEKAANSIWLPSVSWSAAWLEGLYFSFTTFATLGYGDVSYGPEHPLLRMLSTVEAWCGAVFISLFVVLLARKVFR